DEGLAVVLANVVNGTDIRMIQCRSATRLALETFEGLMVAGHIFGQEFQCDVTMEACILGFIDDAHTSTAQFFEHAVVGKGLAKHGGEDPLKANAIVYARISQ